MSLNIAASLLRIASDVSITIPIAALSVRQVKTLVMYLRTGIVKGNGVPAQIARHFRKIHKLGIINTGSYSWVYWQDLAPDEMDGLVAAAATLRLKTDRSKAYDLSYLADAFNRTPKGSLDGKFFTSESAAMCKIHTNKNVLDLCQGLTDNKIKELKYSLHSRSDDAKKT